MLPSGAGPHQIRADLVLSDSTVSSTPTLWVTPAAHAGISGPDYVDAYGNYTFTGHTTGVSGTAASYSWTLVDDATATSTGWGSASTAVVPIQLGVGSFTLTETVSASGYTSQTASKHVYVNTGDCGGFSCLVAPVRKPRAPREGSKHFR